MQGDVLTVLARLPSDHFHAVVTSPPYWGLRDYGVEGQIGLEPTPEAYVAKMVEVFREVRRVLRPDGTLWLNLGDSYAGSGKGIGSDHGKAVITDEDIPATDWKSLGLKSKDLMGIPWRVALALQADGWWLRSDIIWHKPNPMPESVEDRPTKAHEYVFLLTKSARYYYDAEAVKETSEYQPGEREDVPRGGFNGKYDDGNHPGSFRAIRPTRNLRDVWTIPSQPYPEAHFATFPEALVEKPILAGTSEKGCCAECGAPWERVTENKPMVIDRSERTHELGRTRASGTMTAPAESKTTGWRPTCTHDAAVVPCTVLDPFAGSGTTLAVARRLGRNGVGIEPNPAYVKLAEKRLEAVPLAFGAV